MIVLLPLGMAALAYVGFAYSTKLEDNGPAFCGIFISACGFAAMSCISTLFILVNHYPPGAQ